MLLFSTILDINETMTKDDFIKLVIEWNQSSRYSENVIPGINWNGERNVRFENDGLWLDIEEYRNQNIIAVRYEKRDGEGVIWDTDYVMNFNSMKMSIRLDRSFTAEALESESKFSSPFFIALLMERGYVKDDHQLPVQQTETIIKPENVSLLVDVINGKAMYDFPIVYVSKTGTEEDPVDVKLLSKRLKGVAHVFVEEGTWLDHSIQNKCEGKNEYNGSVGVYYPKSGMRHKKFFYRSTEGYDGFLLEKVCQAVLQYCNSQMVDTLFTWQGVNNALLRDRLTSQREERLAAEKAQKEAEANVAMLLDTIDEEERRIREKAVTDAHAEVDCILESFDGDMKKLQDQVEALTRSNEALQYENQGLRAKLGSRDSEPVLYMGDEYDYYPGEIKDLILETLSDAVKGIDEQYRRIDVVKDIIENNDYQKLSVKRAEELKKILKNYDGMSGRTRQALKEMGFEISDEGKHYKLLYYGDERYHTTYSKTPSDGRSMKNSAQDTIKTVF